MTDRFTWRNAEFLWGVGGGKDFTARSGDDLWRARVEAAGIERWAAEIHVAGGLRRGVGATPQEALADALQGWCGAVASVGTP